MSAHDSDVRAAAPVARFWFSSALGQKMLRDISRARLPFDPNDYLLDWTGAILDGHHLIGTTATGDGKSCLSYFPLLIMQHFAQAENKPAGWPWPDNPLVLVICPTKGIEEEQEADLIDLNIDALALNHDRLSAARQRGVDLWKSARTKSMVLLGPELLASSGFAGMVNDRAVWQRIVLACIDELHLLLQWSRDEFLKMFLHIGQLLSRLCPLARICGYSATILPGSAEQRLCDTLGLFYSDVVIKRRSNMRANVQFERRELRSSLKGYSFPELDWIVTSGKSAIVFVDSINTSWHIAAHFCRLLRSHSAQYRRMRIRLYNSLNTPEHNAGTRELLKEWPGTIAIATDTLCVGFSSPCISTVVMINPTSLEDELVSKEPSAPPLQKTNVFNLRSNAANLSYTTGICNALDDFLVTQLGQAKPTETELPRLVIVGGDGATFEGMNRLKKQRQNHTHAFDRFEHVETELELWHACWTEINRFYGAHFGPAGSEDPSTLRASLVHINRPLPSDLKKVDFQSSLDNLMLVGHARMLDCWRVILGSHNLLRDFAEKKRPGTLPSLTEILITAGELSQTYSSIRAHEIATELRCDQPESHRVPANDDWVRLKTDAEIGEEEGFGGDRVLANAIAFLHDFITIREWRHATASGEIGRVYEVLKTVRFNFCGSDHNPRYFGYVLETILSLEYECSDALKHARLQNWLVNPSGLAGHYVEGDLAQEHYIKPLTAYSQRANAAYDGDFERNVLSPNLDNLVQLTRRMEAAVSLARRSQKHTSMHTDPEMRKLLAFYAEHDFHRFHIGNSFGHCAPLHYSRGVACMPAKLKKFLATHRAETDIFGQRWGTPHPEALQSPTFDETAVIPPDNDASAPPAPAAIVDGALLTLQLEVEQLTQESNDVDAGDQSVDDGTAAAQGTGAFGAPRVVSDVTYNQQEHQDASDEEDGGSEIEDTATGEESMAAKYWVGSDASDESDNDVEMTIE